MNNQRNRLGVLVGFIPRQIEASREDEYGACLAGFPVNIYYARVPEVHNGNPFQSTIVCYDYDPLTFEEDEESKRMAYYPRHRSPYWVLVVYRKQAGIWETFKYRGSELVRRSFGRDFRNALFYTTFGGPEVDEVG